MKGDFSRHTFDRTKHYSTVLMQQGRVQLDADWNEQQRIYHYRLETEGMDVIGPSGAPVNDAGFQITVQSGHSLLISKGRYYVDGILCENEQDVTYDQQPDMPGLPDLLTLLKNANATVGLVYLDVWQRHITVIDDPTIRETALGGPDTTTRIKTVWQVKVLPVKPKDPNMVTCHDSFQEWDDLVKPSTGKLNARSHPTASSDNPCLLPPSAGYQRLENQLYRVEVHKDGERGTATFKWSRENGSVVTGIQKITGQDITVHNVGSDDVLGFDNGQLVELVVNGDELSGKPGQLIQIDSVNSATRVITLKSAPAAIDAAGHPKLRRWDSANEINVELPATNDGWIPLEGGVEVKFEAGSYKTGDYWLIPARTATGDVEWPFSSAQPSLGIHHHYCRLALIRQSPDGNIFSVGPQDDCRTFFRPLSEVVPALRVTGINWTNDDVLSLDQLNKNGLQVVLDGVLAATVKTGGTEQVLNTVNNATIIVTLEMPVVASSTTSPTSGPIVSAVLGAYDSRIDHIKFPSPNIIQWMPPPELAQLLALLGDQTFVRVRVTLKGHAIWSDGADQRLYLDGQTFGTPGLRADGTTLRTDLVFPSGANARASDFESWFYLAHTIPPPSLDSFSLNPDTVPAGGSTTGTLTLSGKAPAGGTVINLLSRDPAATLPGGASVTISAGQAQTTFSVTTNASAVSGTKPIQLEASFGGVTIPAQFVILVVSVTITPAQVTLFLGGRQQFSASVTGTENPVTRTSNPAVTWRVQETTGGSVDGTGFYVAPGAAGIYHVIATSVADPSKSATATVTVITKTSKEIMKESLKERIKETVKESVLEKTHVDKVTDKIQAEKVREILGAPSGPGSLRGPLLMERQGDDSPVMENTEHVEGRVTGGQAFIRPEERPEVGREPLRGHG